MQIVTKSEAAAILGVSRPCFSQYLAEGKVDGQAIVGSGHRARIDVDIAREQLRKRLEPVRFLVLLCHKCNRVAGRRGVD